MGIKSFQDRNGPIPALIVAVGLALLLFGGTSSDIGMVGIITMMVGGVWWLVWWKDNRAARRRGRDS